MHEKFVLQLPEVLQGYCERDPSSGDSVLHRSAAALISKLNLSMLSYVLPIFVRDAGLTAAVYLVDIAMQTLPESPILQSWHDTLHTTAAQDQSDVAVIQSALQPYVPTDPCSLADDARVEFYSTGRLDKVNKVLEMFPDDAATLAWRGCVKICELADWAGGWADLKAADQISPIQNFHQLKLLGKYCSDQDTAYSVQIFDRALSLKPATYPAGKAYERIFQQRGACKITLGQHKEGLEDLQMAMKLGDGNDAYAVKTLCYISGGYERTGDIQAALTANEAAFAMDSAPKVLQDQHAPSLLLLRFLTGQRV